MEERAKTSGDKGIGLVIASQGKFFCNGHDVKWLSKTSISEGTRFINDFFETLERIMTLSFPTVAAMSGHAFAGGCLLAMACDYRVMREDRGFVCMNEVDMKSVKPGTYPDADRKVNAVLSSKLPVQILREMMLQGRRYGGKEAQSKRIVDLAVSEDRVLSASIDMAAKWYVFLFPGITLTHHTLKQYKQGIKSFTYDGCTQDGTPAWSESCHYTSRSDYFYSRRRVENESTIHGKRLSSGTHT